MLLEAEEHTRVAALVGIRLLDAETCWGVCGYAGLPAVAALSATARAGRESISSIMRSIRSEMPAQLVICGDRNEDTPEDQGLVTSMLVLDAESARWWPRTPLRNFSEDPFALRVAIMGARLYLLGDEELLRYEPAAKEWLKMPGSPALSRQGFALAAVGDHHLCIAAGGSQDGPVGSVDAFDGSAMAWVSLPAIEPRERCAGAAVGGRYLCVVGGVSDADDEDGEHVVLDCAEAFDFHQMQWSSLPGMPEPRASLAATGTEKRLYVAGGMNYCGLCNDLQVLDFETRAWTMLAPMPLACASLGLVAASPSGEKLLMLGGIGELEDGEVAPLDVICSYDVQRNSWGRMPPLPYPLARCTLALAPVDALEAHGSSRGE